MKILVVPKYRSDTELISLFLAMCGHTVDVAVELDQAADILKSTHHRLLLLSCDLSENEASWMATLFRSNNHRAAVIAMVTPKSPGYYFDADAEVQITNGAPALLSTMAAACREPVYSGVA
jgi:DNA-binding response OmpR family regulator